MKFPLHKLDDCAGIHYRLQLNAYAYILEKYYGHTIATMSVVCTHPDNGLTPFIDNVPFMRTEISHMMVEQRRLAWEITSFEQEDMHIFDPPGGTSQQSEEIPWSLDHQIDLQDEVRRERQLEDDGQEPAEDDMTVTHAGGQTPVMGPTPAECVQDDTDFDLLIGQVPPTPVTQLVQHARTLHVGGASSSAAGNLNMHNSQVVPVTPVGAIPSSQVPAIEKVLGECRKRRLMPGAEDSTLQFRAHFRRMHDSYAAGMVGFKKSQTKDQNSIQHRLSILKEKVTRRMSEQTDEHLVLFVIAALSVVRWRLCDIDIREKVFLVWASEGERFLRVHGGTLWIYNGRGAFKVHEGTLPESTLARVKDFMLIVEGIFRLINPKTTRNQDAVLEAIVLAREKCSSDEAFLLQCGEALSV